MPVRTEGLSRQPLRSRTALICTGGLRRWSPHAICSKPQPLYVQASPDFQKPAGVCSWNQLQQACTSSTFACPAAQGLGCGEYGPRPLEPNVRQSLQSCSSGHLAQRPACHTRAEHIDTRAPANPEISPAGTTQRVSMQRQRSRTGSTLTLLVRPLGGSPLWQQTISGDFQPASALCNWQAECMLSRLHTCKHEWSCNDTCCAGASALTPSHPAWTWEHLWWWSMPTRWL